MNYSFFFKISLFATVSVLFLTACENEDNSSIVSDKATSTEDFIIPKENNDTTVLQINTVEDLQQTLMQVATKHECSLLQNGWIKVEETTDTRGSLKAKRQLRTDTVYELREAVDYYSDPSVYDSFNAKFSKAMVDSINSFVSPQLRISNKKVYVCQWRLYMASYDAKSGEQVSARPSPLCALVPTSRFSYTERGYSLYLHKSKDTNQYQMASYQLRIQREKTSHNTIILDIDWPFFPRNPLGSGHIGYQFIYAVSKRI